MDYKNIFRSRDTRKKILRLLDFIPDKEMIKFQYKMKCGHKLNLKQPKRYTEKLQWYKLYYRNDDMPLCVEKYNVREYVKKTGCGELLNECYGVYDSSSQIPFEELPDKFVIKDTLGGGSNEVVVVKDKKFLNLGALCSTVDGWVSKKNNKKHLGREWPYDGQKHRIIIEKYLEEPNGDLADYKFFCFDGKAQFLYVRTGYASNHDDGSMAFFNRDLEFLPSVGMDYCTIAKQAPLLAENVQEMIKCADKLSQGFPHVRVDFYNVQGKIIFGELTFFNASGYMKFTPDEFDYTMGDFFNVPSSD